MFGWLKRCKKKDDKPRQSSASPSVHDSTTDFLIHQQIVQSALYHPDPAPYVPPTPSSPVSDSYSAPTDSGSSGGYDGGGSFDSGGSSSDSGGGSFGGGGDF